MVEHTVAAFEEELMGLKQVVADMGRLAQEMSEQAVIALKSMDVDAAARVRKSDRKMNEMQRQVEDMGAQIILRRQPLARDLRVVLASLRVAGDLERVGDLAKNIAKQVKRLSGDEVKVLQLDHSVSRLLETALGQLRSVMQAYVGGDISSIENLWLADDLLDKDYKSLFREFLTYMMEDSRNISHVTLLLICARNIERIGDHTTNIVESIHYMETGNSYHDTFLAEN